MPRGKRGGGAGRGGGTGAGAGRGGGGGGRGAAAAAGAAAPGAVWPAVERRSSAEDEYHEDPVQDLCLSGLPKGGGGGGPATGPTRPPDVALPLHDPDWRFDSLDSAHADASPSGDSGLGEAFAALSPEEQELQRQEWRDQLAKIEEDIQLMRDTLQAKNREAQVLKQKLGITMWSELQQDVNQGLQNVKDSQAYRKANEAFSEFHNAVTSAPIYQRTGAALKTTGERATSLFSGLGAKFSEARESATFKSIEERMGSMVTSVKSKVATSHSNSTQSFDDALREAEAAKKQAEGAAPPPEKPAE